MVEWIKDYAKRRRKDEAISEYAYTKKCPKSLASGAFFKIIKGLLFIPPYRCSDRYDAWEVHVGSDFTVRVNHS